MSYLSAFVVKKVENCKTYECHTCNNIKFGFPWVNYDIDNKYICSYLCYKSANNEDQYLWSKVNNKEDFDDVRPVLPKKEKPFVFLTEKELGNFKDDELSAYNVNMNEYYFKDPDRAIMQMNIMAEMDPYDISDEDSSSESDEYYSD